ncbi:hypothetical protein MMC32_006504 [Xylographa parallela]|nr:hypothetical protein [Xylographa parallela]
MFDDFSFVPSAAARSAMDNDARASPLSRGTLASLDEGYCSSVSDSMADLSTRFNRHSLRPTTHHHHHHHHHHHPTASSIPSHRSPLPSNPLHSVRHQRQLATRRQCSTENLSRISHLVERMLQDSSDAHRLASRSAARIAHQSTYLPAGARLSIAATPLLAAHQESSSSCSSPLSPPSSIYDSESDYSLAARSREHHPTATTARSWSTADAGRSRRKDAVEKTARMRKRPGGRTERRKDGGGTRTSQ